MLIHMYTHIDVGTGRLCRIVSYGIPRSVVRSPAQYDLGEDEYKTESTQLELIQTQPITEADIDDAFETVYTGHHYGEDAKLNVKWWFKQGFIHGADAR